MKIPFFLFRLLFGKQIRELERRSKLSGKAARTKNFGPVEMTIEMEEKK